MAGMKFLLSTYSTAFLASGGGESELVQIAETLNESAVHADIYGIQSRPLDFYDAVMHFSVQAEGKAFFDAVRARQTPILLWPNVWWNSPPAASSPPHTMTRVAPRRWTRVSPVRRPTVMVSANAAYPRPA